MIIPEHLGLKVYTREFGKVTSGGESSNVQIILVFKWNNCGSYSSSEKLFETFQTCLSLSNEGYAIDDTMGILQRLKTEATYLVETFTGSHKLVFVPIVGDTNGL